MIAEWGLYLLTGAVAGVMAGLLGVGGGLVIVPALVFAFAARGFDASVLMHLALGTSLASIVFTSLSSLRAHHARGAVRWDVVQGLTPGIVAGTLGGAWLAGGLTAGLLRGIFVVFVFYVATQMLLGFKPRPSRQLPPRAGLWGAGGVIGTVSSLVGIGGGTLTVPFLGYCNVGLHQAIGTSAAVGLPIALAGSAGYVWAGWSQAGLPPGTLGFIHLPALAGVVVASVLTAPLGARLAHALPVPALKRVFAGLLYLIGLKMAWGLWS